MEASLNGPLGRTTLGQGMLKIGRAPDNTLVINDPQSSSHHAEVGPGFGGSGYQVTDLNSTNGTFVNEQRLTPNTPRQLNTGDIIRIGALRLTYEATSGHAPTVAASSFNSDQTLPNQSPGAQPTLYAQAPAFSNYNAPASITPPPPPPAFTPPQAGGFNQAAYPPGGFGQSVPQPKKSRVGLWIGLIVLLLLIVGGSFAGYVYVNRSTPEKTLQAYCTALQNNDAQGLYNTLSSKDQARTDLQKISTGLQLLKLLTGGFTNCTSSNVQVNGSTASAMLTLTPARGNTISQQVALVNDNGQWKMTTANKNLPGA
jgi:hypothetical protein